MTDRNKAIDRMLARGATRAVQRANPALPEAVERLARRDAGASLTRAPLSIDVKTTTSDDVGIATAADLRSEVARQVAELVTLSADKGLLRAEQAAAEGGEGSKPAGPGADAGDQGDQAVLDQWYSEMEAKGLTLPEIEEIMVEQLRGLRRGLQAMSADRKVGR